MQRRARAGSGTNQGAVRRHNLGTLLGHVHVLGRISRSDLTAQMGLNRSTIAGLVAELESLGLATQVPSEAARSSAGRPSPDVVPVAEGAHVLAVNVRVDSLTVARVGLGGVVLAQEHIVFDPNPAPEDVCDEVLALARRVVKDANPRSPLVGIGVAVPGLVNRDDGVVRLAPNLGWVDVPFAALLRRRLADLAAVVVRNDADLGALAEHVRGAGIDVTDLIYLSGEVGVGAGVVVGGHWLEGSSGHAGEVGHLTLDPNGRECHCGNRGCWETQVGAVAIAEAVDCPPEQVASLGEFLAGVEHANDALRGVARDLGRGLANLVNVVNPRVIVLGGYLRSLYPLVAHDVQAALADVALVAPHEQVRLALPALEGDSVLVGAAETAFAALLADPVESLHTAQCDIDAAVSALL